VALCPKRKGTLCTIWPVSSGEKRGRDIFRPESLSASCHPGQKQCMRIPVVESKGKTTTHRGGEGVAGSSAATGASVGLGARRVTRRKRKAHEINSSSCSSASSSSSSHSPSKRQVISVKTMACAASGCTGSSKAPTIKNGGLNEDRFQISDLSDTRYGNESLFVGVFDGHGGSGASSFLFERYLGRLKKLINKNSAEKDLAHILHDSFLDTDKALYEEVANLGKEFEHLREERCKCNFYRESPCRCLQAPRSAHEGSTATVIAVVKDRLYCANVGDSEAVLVTKSGFVKSSNDAGCREFDSPGARSAVTFPSSVIVGSASGSSSSHSSLPASTSQIPLVSSFPDENNPTTSTPMEDVDNGNTSAEEKGEALMKAAVGVPPQPPPSSSDGELLTEPMIVDSGEKEDEFSESNRFAASSTDVSEQGQDAQPATNEDQKKVPVLIPAQAGGKVEEQPSITEQTSTTVKPQVGSQTGHVHPTLILRKVEPGVPQTEDLEAETLTIADTPVPDLLNEDYIRVKQIAETRVRRKASKTRSNRSDGIRRGVSDRFNYVALEGAHSLNMTRAFGNFGHKVFSENGTRVVVERQSPIIVRPHVNIFEQACEEDFLFFVVASDGLWDNLNRDEVVDVVKRFCAQRIAEGNSRRNSTDIADPTQTKKDNEIRRTHSTCIIADASDLQDEAKTPEQTSIDALLVKLAEGASEELLSCALSRNRKQDDITVVVVLFPAIISELSPVQCAPQT